MNTNSGQRPCVCPDDVKTCGCNPKVVVRFGAEAAGERSPFHASQLRWSLTGSQWDVAEWDLAA